MKPAGLTLVPLVPPLLAALALHAGDARADDDAHRRAAESFRQAQAAFERRDFAAAAAAFEQAADFEPHPAPVLDAADAWERAGEAVRAADDCDRALAMPTITDAYRSDAEQCLRRVAPKLSTLDFRGPSTVSVRVDAGPRLIVPAVRRVAPGHHTIAVTDLTTSRSHPIEVDLRGGETRPVEVAPDVTPLAAATPPVGPRALPAQAGPATARGGVPTSAWLAFGAASASAATAVVSGLFTLSARSTFDGGEHTQSAADTFYRDQTITNVAWGVAGAAAAVGVVLWLTAPRAASTPSLGVAPDPAGARLVAAVELP